MRLAALLLALAMLATACSEASPGAPGPTPTPTEPAASTTPAPVPGLFLVAPDGTGTSGAAGTRCWAGVCIDYIGPVTPAEPVTFAAGSPLEWQAEGGTVTELSHGWVPAGGVASSLTSEGTRAWNVGPGSYSGDSMMVPSEPGEYLLVVFTRYSTGDDVLFGFYIRVE